MIPKILVFLQLLFLWLFQDNDTIRQVMRKHPDGSAYVVLYFKASTQELVREEVYFPNGNVQWVGSYKNELEEGTWKYFYENGRIKSEQNYSRGKENGICSDFDHSGRLVRQSTYKNGRLEREMNF